MNTYDPKQIEQKWQKKWEADGLYKTPDEALKKDKMYILPQLPYPSGSGLHVGHAEVYTACDMYARYQRMTGKKVLQAIGWDSFGLPAENYAIKTNVHPRKSTEDAIQNFRTQIKSLGISVDWDKEVASHDSSYYKWTQWFFLLMYKRGLAYRKKQLVNWCEDCKTVLANEQVVDGKCERSETVVVQKEMEQWYLKITEYADRLLEGLNRIDWPEETKKRQRDWIGRSEGTEIVFAIRHTGSNAVDEGHRVDGALTVFTTRPDTIFGVMYMVISPEHVMMDDMLQSVDNRKEVEKYIKKAAKRTELERQVDQDKTGVELKGVTAVNPVSGEEIPVWIGDYVLASYGTGAIMAVPAHDERDFAFAKKYKLPVKPVVLSIADASYSYVMGVTREDVTNLGVDIIEETSDGFFKICIPWERLDDYKTFIREKIKPKFWNEFSTQTGFYFIFKHPNGQIEEMELNKSTNDIIDRYGHTFNDEAVGDVRENVYCWLAENDFYSKLLIHTDSGIAINSDFLDGLSTTEAKEKIIEYLEEKRIGKRKTQYKLRDWSVSRQRFWGAPIPMIVSEERKNRKRTFVHVHGFKGSGDSNYFPRLRQFLEEQGHTVYAPTLPNSEKPILDEQVQYLIDNISIDKDTVILGHSLGGPVVIKWLAKTKQKVAKVIFSDSFFIPEFNDGSRLDVEKSTDWTALDPKAIKSLADEFVCVIDNKFPIIPQAHSEEFAEILGARIVYATSNGEHFDGAHQPIFEEEVPVSGILPLTVSDLPVELPGDVDFKPTGQSPLTYSDDFQKGVEEKYGKGWRREVDTLDTFMCSSWYYYRYLDPNNDKEFASSKMLKEWMPVDFYLGGAEHVNGHLLYSRFFTKVLFDVGYIDFDEPFLRHRHQGIILGEDNRKMSKRWGNVVNPTDVVNEYGADTCRMYEMFMGSLEETKPWNTGGVKGIRRFLEKVWKLQDKVSSNTQYETSGNEVLLHKTIKKVTDDIQSLQFNTSIAKMMELVNAWGKREAIAKNEFEIFLKLLAPYAPHMAEELWESLGHSDSVCIQPWPCFDVAKIADQMLTIAVQVNGKLRATIEVDADASEGDVKLKALAEPNVIKWLNGKEPKKIMYVKERLVSVVV